MFVRPSDPEAGEASSSAADAPLKPPTSARVSTTAAAAQAVSVALVVRSATRHAAPLPKRRALHRNA